MAMEKVEGIHRFIKEFGIFFRKVHLDPNTEKIKPERKKVHPRRLFPEELGEAISLTDLGGRRFLCTVRTLDCYQLVTIQSKNGESLRQKVDEYNQKRLSRLGVSA